MAKTSNVYDITMHLMSKALYLKDVFEFATCNGTINISLTVTQKGSIANYPILSV